MMTRPRRRHTDAQPRPWRLIVVTAVCSIAITAALFVAGYALAARSVDIEESRRTAIEDSCVEQNERHDATITALDELLAERQQGASKAEAERLQQSRTNTVLLIEALAPKRDCERRAEQLTE